MSEHGEALTKGEKLSLLKLSDAETVLEVLFGKPVALGLNLVTSICYFILTDLSESFKSQYFVILYNITIVMSLPVKFPFYNFTSYACAYTII